jgi:hypothetical protein
VALNKRKSYGEIYAILSKTAFKAIAPAPSQPDFKVPAILGKRAKQLTLSNFK